MFDISDKIAVVTGGAGVLGGSFALHLARSGVKVAIIDIRQEQIAQRADEIINAGGHAIGYVASVLDLEQLKDIRQQILSQWGRVDILINAAGGNIPGATLAADQSVFDMNMDDFEKVTDLNLQGTVYPTLVFGEAMAGTGAGSIINISSMATYSAITKVMGYSVAKSGINMFTKWMAMEMARKYGEKIRVNAIAPGFFVGDQNRNILLNPDGSYTERSLKILSHTPMSRFGNVDELNGAVHFLCSDAASFITGVILPVDGGFSSFSGI